MDREHGIAYKPITDVPNDRVAIMTLQLDNMGNTDTNMGGTKSV